MWLWICVNRVDFMALLFRIFILLGIGLLRQIYDLPRNDERVERFYFLQKQNEAKTFIRIFDLIFFTRFAQSANRNRSNGGSALRRFYAKQAK